MIKNSLRITPSSGSSYERKDDDDPRFLDDFAAIQSIVTSSGEDDSGLFQLDLKDDRYLPFEGAGTISRWRIENEGSTKLDKLEDVIFHIRYTARDGGKNLQEAARSSAASKSTK